MHHPTAGDLIRQEMPLSFCLELGLVFVFREIGFLIATFEITKFASKSIGRAVIRNMA
jgi:predicted acetyltransferase